MSTKTKPASTKNAPAKGIKSGKAAPKKATPAKATKGKPSPAKSTPKTPTPAPVATESKRPQPPKPGNTCAQVWALADQYKTRGEVLRVGGELGINKHTLSTQFARWRSHHGIVGRATVSA